MVLRPFAIMELLQGRTADDVARLVVNPGDQFTDIVVAKGNQTVSTRSIRMSPNHSADQRSQLLVSEVRRTIASSKRQLGGSPIGSVILLDDEKSNKHLVGNLNERLKIEVEVVNPLDGVQRIGQAKADLDSPWQYSPLLGSVANFGREAAPAIDFRNPSRRKEVVVDRSRWWLYGGLAGLAALMTIAFAWWTLRSQAAEIAELNEELIAAIKLNEGEGNRPSMQSVIERTGVIDDWQKSSVQWLGELDEMSQRFLTADEVMVSRFEAAVRRKIPSVAISGKFKDSKQDRILFKSLEQRPYDVTPTKPPTLMSEPDDYTHTFGSSLTILQQGDAWLTELDEHVRQFHQKRNEARMAAAGETSNGNDAGDLANEDLANEGSTN